MYNDEQNVTTEPEEARRFFAKPHNILVAIEDDNDNSTVKVCLSGSCDLASMQGFLQTLRLTATKYNMLFNTEQYGEEIEPKKFASKSLREGNRHMTELTEQMYGTSRSSYLRLESAKMIVRHSKKIVDETARSRNIGSIFVENSQGERFLFPTNSLLGGRAMTQHVNQGGSWADPVGEQIQRMASDFQDLGQAASFIDHNSEVIAEGAVPVSERCKACRKGMRKIFERLYRASTYAAECAKLQEAGEPPLIEGTVIENLRETLKVNGKELSESILNAVARAMNEGEGERSLTEADENAGMVSVLGGQRVSEKAWDDLKHSRIELVKPVKVPSERPPNWDHAVGGTPKLNAIDKARWKLGFIIPVVKDDSLCNLLQHIETELVNQKDMTVFAPEVQKLRKDMFVVVGAVLRAAHVPIDLKEGIGPKGVKAVSVLENWFDNFLPERVLFREGIDADFASTQDIEDVEDAEDIKENARDVDTEMGSTDDDRFHDSSEDERYRDFDMDGESADMRDVDDDGNVMEDTELTQEDIVLPKRTQGEDLAADVVSKDPDSARFAASQPSLQVAEGLARMKRLAGLTESEVHPKLAKLLVDRLNRIGIMARESENASYFTVPNSDIATVCRGIDRVLGQLEGRGATATIEGLPAISKAQIQGSSVTFNVDGARYVAACQNGIQGRETYVGVSLVTQ
jgi:hypothetical protein